MDFEFNKEKNTKNQEKHGIDFVAAQRLWQGFYVEFAAKKSYENRFAIIGKLDGICYTCIFTLRGKAIRLISCRRSREKEKDLYEKTIEAT